jgi:hypothetical protein
MAINPDTPAILYAGTQGRGVFKTTNGGGTWLPLNRGLTDSNVHALAIDPLAPANLNAATDSGGVYSIQQSFALAAVGPGLGLTNGGTAIAIFGGDFAPGATATIGQVAVPGATVVDAGVISATTAAHAAGPVDVVVTNPDHNSVTLHNGFVYADVIYQTYLPITRR